jgi:predicted transcriptional regulator
LEVTLEAIILSIKPEYAERIINGVKKYEYRKIIARKEVNKIYIYATYPVMKIIGEVSIDGDILKGSPTAIWERTKQNSGISRSKYRLYFKGKKYAYAYPLGKITRYDSPKHLSDFGLSQPPQSFVYVR